MRAASEGGMRGTCLMAGACPRKDCRKGEEDALHQSPWLSVGMARGVGNRSQLGGVVANASGQELSAPPRTVAEPSWPKRDRVRAGKPDDRVGSASRPPRSVPANPAIACRPGRPAIACRARQTGHRVPAQQTGHRVPARQTGHRVPARQTGHRVPAQQTGHRVPARQTGHRVRSQQTRPSRAGPADRPSRAGVANRPSRAGSANRPPRSVPANPAIACRLGKPATAFGPSKPGHRLPSAANRPSRAERGKPTRRSGNGPTGDACSPPRSADQHRQLHQASRREADGRRERHARKWRNYVAARDSGSVTLRRRSYSREMPARTCLARIARGGPAEASRRPILRAEAAGAAAHDRGA